MNHKRGLSDSFSTLNLTSQSGPEKTDDVCFHCMMMCVYFLICVISSQWLPQCRWFSSTVSSSLSRLSSAECVSLHVIPKSVFLSSFIQEYTHTHTHTHTLKRKSERQSTHVTICLLQSSLQVESVYVYTLRIHASQSPSSYDANDANSPHLSLSLSKC